MRLRFLIPIALALAVVTTAATTFVNRPYAAGLTGETGCATDDNNPYGLCRDMRPQGGFPLIHISDSRSGANTGKLGPEDDLYPVSIAGNVAGYMAVWLALIGALSLATARRTAPADAGPPASAPEATADIEASDAPPSAPEPAPAEPAKTEDAPPKPENAPPG
ncbi:MAG: hypothetical protein GC206_16595 [Alphaproteobacteria bacterium]|nr:hypothetical protein [Alphaproteobacteria bacterium]